MAKNYTIGLEIFEKSIKLEIEHVGAHHHNLVNKYTNGGICALEAGKTGKAKAWLDSALYILDLSKSVPLDAPMSPSSADIRSRIESALASIR